MSTVLTLPALLSLLIALTPLPIFGAREGFARTWRLHPDGSGDAASVMAAAESAASGDTLLLDAGLYQSPGRITIFKKTLLVRGAGREQTILEGPVHGNIVYLQGPGNSTEFRDLTIRGGHADVLGDPLGIGSDGGGIYAEAADFTLRNVRITECTAGVGGGLGGAIFMTSLERVRSGANGRALPGAGRRAGRLSPAADGLIVLTGCRFDNCISGSEGGAISAENAVFQITDSTFENNDSVDGGGLRVFDSYGSVTGCLFLNNHAEFYGGGLKVQQSLDVVVEVSGNTFYGNRAERGGAGCELWQCVNTFLTRNIFAAQAGTSGDAFRCQLPGEPTVACNLVFGNANPELGNCPVDNRLVTADPQFCAPGAGDFRLCAASPAVEGPGACGRIGAYDVGCTGVGCATAVHPTTWSALKALYRNR